jgi:hypothetical protein
VDDGNGCVLNDVDVLSEIWAIDPKASTDSIMLRRLMVVHVVTSLSKSMSLSFQSLRSRSQQRMRFRVEDILVETHDVRLAKDEIEIL